MELLGAVVTVAIIVVLIYVAAWFSQKKLRWTALIGFLAVTVLVIERDSNGGDVKQRFIAAFQDLVTWFWSFTTQSDVKFTKEAWIGFLVLVAFGYYLLEQLSARRDVPKVDVAEPTDETNEESKRLIAELRFRLPAVSLNKPANVPGASRGDTIASIVEAVAGGKKSELATHFLRLGTSLWPSPRCYIAKLYAEHREIIVENTTLSYQDGSDVTGTRRRETDYHRDGRSTDGHDKSGLFVTVDLVDAKSGTNIAVTTFGPATEVEAAERAAAYVAAVVLRSDPTTPDWAKGGFEHAEDLAALLLSPPLPHHGCTYRELQHERKSRVEHFEMVGLHGPASGAVRYELALNYDLLGRQLEALRLYSRNRADHPRFHESRYRLAISLAMAAGRNAVELWKGKDNIGMRPSDIAKDLQSYLIRAGMGKLEVPEVLMSDDAEADVNSSEMCDFRRQLLRLSKEELEAARRSMYFFKIWPWMLISRKQRSSLRKIARPREWRQQRNTIISAQKFCDIRLTLIELRPESGRTLKELDASMGNMVDIFYEAKKDANILLKQKSPLREHPWQDVYHLACTLAIVFSYSKWLNSNIWEEDEGRWREVNDFFNKHCLHLDCISLIVDLLRLAADSSNNPRASEWVGHDPDLAGLHDDRLFKRFLCKQIQRDFKIDTTAQQLRSPSELTQIDAWFVEQVIEAGRGPRGAESNAPGQQENSGHMTRRDAGNRN